jgi:hypothetical protein
MTNSHVLKVLRFMLPNLLFPCIGDVHQLGICGVKVTRKSGDLCPITSLWLKSVGYVIIQSGFDLTLFSLGQEFALSRLKLSQQHLLCAD